GKGHDARGVELDDVEPDMDGDVLRFRHVTLDVNRAERMARLTVAGPKAADAAIPADPASLGPSWYALRMWRELRRSILELRFNYPEIGLVTFHTEGDPSALLALDEALAGRREHWFVRETLLQQARTLKMIDVTARTFFAIITPGSCFAGSLFELALAADRAYMLDDPERENAIVLSGMNAGEFRMAHGLTRLENRFYGSPESLSKALGRRGEPLHPEAAKELGLVTDTLDDIDWDDEIRIILEERRSLSPDALTGLEANLRFVGPETMESRIYARLSAWQNWIFTRPNAVGERGALTSYGKPYSPEFDWSRV
ncbi:MAG TPA: benzoyl-CoA-dihydrodiol lyase, partial [Candidatus Krumholzibacteria bacterium]|nr:benzoyl-CoA-dihydrodiol lyase [Candidatus Krumholzibacteria bacterium]